VLIACWSSKGGSGTTVVAAALAVALSGSSSGSVAGGVVFADFCGDGPAVLGVPEPEGPGLSDWLAAGDDVPPDGISRLEVDVVRGLKLLARGSLPFDAGRADALAAAFAADARPVVADCGTLVEEAAQIVAANAARSLLVVRPCFLALRRALLSPVRPSGVVLVNEAGRALGGRDIEELLGVPVCARVECLPEVARMVDAGLLTSRLPRRMVRALRGVA
jgi:MinD-like ATPase involved in chromosome partitioning or flagellar assembly